MLYGDPSLPGSVIHANAMTRLTGKTIHPALACRRSGIIQKRMLPDALVAKVKGPAAKATRDSERARSWTLTLKKDLPVENDAHASVHRQVVRVTADGAGHILKLAVSK